jgi:ribosomal protein L16/L10AE
MEGVTLATATEAMRLAAMKLSVPTKFISRNQPEVVAKAKEGKEAGHEA